MKEMNGTITLVYIEEDNKQRIIFRALPLCTKEGVQFNNNEIFPDQGSIRIVPDKREQNSFKDRMRNISGLCVIKLQLEGKEVSKVRLNRNYSPNQGEKNKFAIYSDVICEFEDDCCFEVLSLNETNKHIITKKILILKDKVLYGPVLASELDSINIKNLKPFGNDSFLLHHINHQEIGEHTIYWQPEKTLSWRQRKQQIQKENKSKKNNIEKNTIEIPEKNIESTNDTTKPVQAEIVPETNFTKKSENTTFQNKVKEKQEKQEKQENTENKFNKNNSSDNDVTPKSDAPEIVSPNNSNSELPIGEKLNILDEEISFEEQLSRLNQPLNQLSNRLDVANAEKKEAPPKETTQNVKINGTPLVKSVKPIRRNRSEKKSVEMVVDQAKYDDSTIEDERFVNPIEKFTSELNSIWKNPTLRAQAMRSILKNDYFVDDIHKELSQLGLGTQAYSASQQQLVEIEAERLNLLFQLDLAKNEEKQYKNNVYNTLHQSKRDELHRIKHSLIKHQAQLTTIKRLAKTLNEENNEKTENYLMHNINAFCSLSEHSVLLSAVIGENHDTTSLVISIRETMLKNGFIINEAESLHLLLDLALNNVIVLEANSIWCAKTFAEILINSFGLTNVSTYLNENSTLNLLNLLDNDADRTPTISIQRIGSQISQNIGHKTLLIAHKDEISQLKQNGLCCPIINISSIKYQQLTTPKYISSISPTSLSSILAITENTNSYFSEMEQWFTQFQKLIEKYNIIIPDGNIQQMKRYVAISTKYMNASFIEAIDYAVLRFVVPFLPSQPLETQQIETLFGGLVQTLNQLNSKQYKLK